MKKYARVLSAIFASLLVFGLASCQWFNDPSDPLKGDYISFDSEYVSEYGEKLTVTSKGVLTAESFGEVNTAKLIEKIQPEGYEGTVVIVKWDSHVNYGTECYPDYDEDKWEGSVVDADNYGAITHHNCYSAIYIEKTSDKAIKMAAAVWHPEGEPIGWTACAKSVDDVHKLFETCGYKDTCEAYSSVMTIAE